MTRLESLSAVVTGGSKGIGFATALRMAQAGARVVICAREQAGLDAAASRIEAETGSRPHTVSVDLSVPEGPPAAAAQATELLGQVDILVNVAGAAPPGGIAALTDEQWALALDLKLLGYIRMTRELVPGMAERNFGRIINVAGGSWKQPTARTLSAGIANAGVLTLTKGVATEYARQGVTVNAVCPGRTKTERFEELLRWNADQEGISPEQAYARAVADVPTGELSTPEDVAHAVLFFAARETRQLTGQALYVDGGNIKAL